MTGNLPQQKALFAQPVCAGVTTPVIVSEHICATADGQPLLLECRRDPQGATRPLPVLLVHGLAQNRATWHLHDRSFANYLVSQGYEVWLAELRGHGRSRACGAAYAKGVDDYMDRDIPAVLEFICRTAGSPRLLYIGHSLGGLLGLCQRPEQQARLAGIAALGTPLYLGAEACSLQALAWAYTLAERNSVLRFRPGAPIRGELIGWLNRRFEWWLDKPGNPFPLTLWAPGSMAKPALRELLHSFDRTGVGNLRFVMNWVRSQQLVNPRTGEDLSQRLHAQRVPALLVVGSHDNVVPQSAIEPGLRLLGNTTADFRLIGEPAQPCGHFDIVLGDAAPQRVWPQVAEWLEIFA